MVSKLKRILLIEDEVSIAELQRDYLEINDFQVDVEHSGETGLQMKPARRLRFNYFRYYASENEWI